MNTSDELVWYRATTLVERLAAGRPSGSVGTASEDSLPGYDRLQSWKSQAPFDTGSFFEQRLVFDGLTETELRQFLLEPVEAIWSRFPDTPGWLTDLRAALSQSFAHDILSLLPAELTKTPTIGFLNAAAPLLDQALDRLDKGIAGLMKRTSCVLFDPLTVKKILFADVPKTMLEMLGRTMVLELNVARLEGNLKGTTPEERFRSFLERLRQPGAVPCLLRDYPVLARLLAEQAQRWVDVSLEFLERLCRDGRAVQAAFARQGDLGVLVGAAQGMADAHRGGQSVIIARFSSGIRIVYKPKSLAVDAHFQELLQWLNTRGVQPSFRTLTVVDRGSYGWVEFVATQECGSSNEVRRFYNRQGGYLALLYALEATDFHAGNVIASGEHPVLVDLEALFHPHRARGDASGLDSADRIARRAISRSVLRTGLLPERVWSNTESEGVDVSGLGTVDGQLTPHGLPGWEEMGTDTMHLVRRRKPIRAKKNRPKLHGGAIDVLDYREAILAGFASTSSLLLNHRNELLSVGGPLARFGADEVCVFLRSARTYRRLLRESYHPDVLRDALDRDRLFDLLWVEVKDDHDLLKVIRAERADLLHGDIPQFTTRPGSRDLWTSAGDRIPAFFGEASLSAVERRLHEPDESFARQAWFIQASLATLAADGAHWPRYSVEPGSKADDGRLRSAAQAVGDRLEELALRGEGGASWIGLTIQRGRSWSVASFGLDMSGGLPGVALFLAYLGAVTGKERYTALAHSALTTLQRQIERRRSSVTWIGGFDGWGGVLYVLTHLGVLWDRPELIGEAEALVERLPALIEKDDVFDLFAGAAGCIGALRCLHACAPSDRVSAVAVQCGDHLLASAQPMEEGIGWLPKFGGQRPLAGFAHGAAGMSWALLELHAWTGSERFRTAALAALAYERGLFVEDSGNWADLREHGGRIGAPAQSGLMTAWCHGAPGIALARLSSLPHADDAAIRAEIAVALETTLQKGFGHNHSLCHGDLGSVEVLWQASRAFGDPRWEAQARRASASILESIEKRGWLCGVPFGVETPGLMTGLAGIGYQLLRLAEPQRVPSVLVLDPPPSSLPQRGDKP